MSSFAIYQASLSLGFPKQEYWSGLQFHSPKDFPDPGIKPVSPTLTGRFFLTTDPPGKLWVCVNLHGCYQMDDLIKLSFVITMQIFHPQMKIYYIKTPN